MEVKLKFNDINVKEEKEKTLVKVLMLKGEKGEKGDGDFNVIEDVKVNGTSLPVSGKSVNVEIPTNNSAFNNDSGYLVENDMQMVKVSDIQNGSQITDGTGYGRINKIYGDTSQNGTPTPDNPIDVDVVTGDVSIVISNSDNSTSQNYLLSLGELELCKIGTFKDYLHKENGKWYLHKEIEKIVLNGSETWFNVNTGTSGKYRFNCDIGTDILTENNANVAGLFYSDKIKSISRTDTYNCVEGIAPTSDSFSYKSFCVYINNLSTATVNEFKTWLSSHNIIVYYVLGTSKEIEITDTILISQLNEIYNFDLYSNETNFAISSNNLLPYLNITYAITDRDIYSKEEVNDLLDEEIKKVRNYFYIKNTYTENDIINIIENDIPKVIEFEKGTYTFTKRVCLTSNTLFLLNGSTFNSAYSDTYGDNLVFMGYPLDSEFTEYNGISNIKFVNGKINTSFAFMHNTNIEFNNIEFDNITSHVFQIGGCKDFRILNCIFNGSLIDDVNGENHELIQLECATYGGQPYLDQDNPTYDETGNINVVIDNCIFNKGNETTTRNYVCIGHHSSLESNKLANKNIKITNNRFYDCYYSAISGGSFDNVIIANNIFEQDTEHAQHIHIRLRVYNENVYIYNNVLKNGRYGIYQVNVKQNKKCYIYDNKIDLVSSDSVGICFSSIENCYIHDNHIKSLSQEVIIQQSENDVTDNINIIQNKFDMKNNITNKHCVALYGGTNIVVRDNIIEQGSNTNNFIWINGATSYYIANNKIIGDSQLHYLNGNNIDYSNIYNIYKTIYQASNGTYSALDDTAVNTPFNVFNRLMLTLHKNNNANVLLKEVLLPYSIFSKLDTREYPLLMNIDGVVKTATFKINSDGTFDYSSQDSSVTLRNIVAYNE